MINIYKEISGWIKIDLRQMDLRRIWNYLDQFGSNINNSIYLISLSQIEFSLHWLICLSTSLFF